MGCITLFSQVLKNVTLPNPFGERIPLFKLFPVSSYFIRKRRYPPCWHVRTTTVRPYNVFLTLYAGWEK